MERRKFITISTSAIAALSLPVACFSENYDAQIAVMSAPAPLSSFCSAGDIDKIGSAYLEAVVDEDSPSAIGTRLFKGSDGNIVKAEKVAVNQLLREKIQKDFEEDNTMILDGWVLSKTEGRICAALSFAQ
jgi:hypothetical protein